MMQVSNSNNQYMLLQQRSSAKSGDSSSDFDRALLAASGGEPTQEDLRTGFFGSSRATLNTIAATGKYVINTLSYLTSSDIDLIQRTTGVSIKNGGYYDSNGDQLGIRYDSHGNSLDPDPSRTKAAFDLAQTLSEMRDSGGPQGDVSLQNGRKITPDDLEAYLKAYAAAKASGQNVYVPNASVIKQAEQILESE
ncbi:hypothetical protein [Methylosinus sporium]|uniref:hypothetical protein n=1 Tax=Methylosinus sporium TaxID=428 RepID=UPI00383B7311